MSNNEERWDFFCKRYEAAQTELLTAWSVVTEAMRKVATGVSTLNATEDDINKQDAASKQIETIKHEMDVFVETNT